MKKVFRFGVLLCDTKLIELQSAKLVRLRRGDVRCDVRLEGKMCEGGTRFPFY